MNIKLRYSFLLIGLLVIIVMQMAYVHKPSVISEPNIPNKTIFARWNTRSPSLKAPLVIVACESKPAHEDPYISIDDAADAADSDPQAAIRLITSWERQREQMTTMLKTLLYFSEAPVWRIIVLTDSLATFDKVRNLSRLFPKKQRDRLRLEHRDQWYPKHQSDITANWRPCVWAKQFLAEALPDEDAAVYVDTDLVFLGPAEEIWDLFELMDAQQVVALSPEPKYSVETPRRKYAGRTGLNTGVMVANLTRQRSLLGGGLGTALLNSGLLNHSYRHDQDVLNHFLMDKPHLFTEVSARWNFMVSSCHRIAPPCPDCQLSGVLILHGADVSFYRLVEGLFLVSFASYCISQLEK